MGTTFVAPKEIFGPYYVYDRLGIGGMATVHRATKQGIAGFERACALKRLLPHLAEDAAFVHAFVREAKLSGHLQHSNIAQIYELGRVGTTYYMAMEYVEGHDLRKVLRQAARAAGLPPVGVVIGILNQLCDALDYAHHRTDDGTDEPLGIVHRDVSPSNLIVTPSGHLKVIDFGIAKATAEALRSDTGRVKGKLGYMSPEAIDGKSLDARSDLFSAGVIAWELLCARPLFSSKNDYDTLTRVRTAAVEPPSSRNADCPPALDRIVMRALAKSRDARFASAAAMREALHAVAFEHDLDTSNRAIAGWSRWAFSLQPSSRDRARSASELAVWRPPSEHDIPRGDAPLPIAEADDQIVEIAWGGRNDLGPVVVPNVPDVSDQVPLAALPPAAMSAEGPASPMAGVSVREEPTPAFLMPRISYRRSRRDTVQRLLDQAPPMPIDDPGDSLPFIVWKSGDVWDPQESSAPRPAPVLARGTRPPEASEAAGEPTQTVARVLQTAAARAESRAHTHARAATAEAPLAITEIPPASHGRPRPINAGPRRATGHRVTVVAPRREAPSSLLWWLLAGAIALALLAAMC